MILSLSNTNKHILLLIKGLYIKRINRFKIEKTIHYIKKIIAGVIILPEYEITTLDVYSRLVQLYETAFHDLDNERIDFMKTLYKDNYKTKISIYDMMTQIIYYLRDLDLSLPNVTLYNEADNSPIINIGDEVDQKIMKLFLNS